MHSFKFQVSARNKGATLDCSSGKAHSTLYKPQGILHMSQSWRCGNLIQRRGCHVLKSIGDDEAISCVTTHNLTHLRIEHQNITSHMYICCLHTITTIFQHHNLLKSDLTAVYPTRALHFAWCSPILRWPWILLSKRVCYDFVCLMILASATWNIMLQ